MHPTTINIAATKSDNDAGSGTASVPTLPAVVPKFARHSA
jgi:hypothetical protein